MEFLSEGCQQLTGYPASAFLGPNGRSFNSVIHPDDREPIWAGVQAALKNHSHFHLEYRIRTASGEEKRVSERGCGVYSEDGQLEALEGFIEDVTDRWNMTNALRLSEQRYRDLVNSVPVGLYQSTADGRMLFANPALVQMLGFESAKELETADIGDDFYADPRVRQGFTEELERNGRLTGAEYQLKRRDGSLITVLENCRVVEDPSGERCYEGMLLDITDRKNSEMALKREREFVERVIDTVPGIFFVIDENRRYIRWNRNHQTLFGQAREAILGLDALDRIHPEDQPIVAKAVERIFAEGSGDVEARGLVGAGPETRHFWMTGRRLDVDGASYLVGCGIDVTDRKKAEAERAVLEAELVQSQKLESVGRLAGGIAHDFNNLLTVINGYGAVVMDEVTSRTTKDKVAQILEAGGRAAALTQQLLAFARRDVVRPQLLTLNSVITDALRLVRRLIGEDVRLECSLAPDLRSVVADSGQIGQILINLAANARDAIAARGAIRIETRNVRFDDRYAATHATASAGDYVLLSMTDTGAGMDAETQAHIFEPFFTTKAAGKGTGLGLATVHGIVTRSGGHISVESAPGRGSTFRIYFPASNGRQEEPSSAPAGDMGLRAGVETVLVAEDQPDVRQLIGELLSGCGYTVVAGSSADHVIEQARRLSKADLLVTDVVMPGASGLELAEAVRELFPRMKVLFISGYTSEVVVRRGMLRPGMRFLAKPFSPTMLADEVRRILDDRDEG
ncbi:MAG: PAS domain S-box protein [Acidobacteria bacterium]|nr:PAS domain S-box protein [Acidobacteriota bacterium]